MKRALALCLCAAIVAGLPSGALGADSEVSLWFPPAWKAKAETAREIAGSLQQKAGVTVKPRIAQSYPQILAAFDSDDSSLVYVGSFVQAIIRARELGTPLVQAIDGKEMYSGIMVYPKGQDPKAILRDSPAEIAFTIGASSGESSAKAATGGKASLGVANHLAAARAVHAGKAKAAVVKNWWWESNKQEFADFEVYRIPGVSEERNPDNVLTASKSMPGELAEKLSRAAVESVALFGAKEMAPFDGTKLEFSLELMKKGGIDPNTYSW